MRPVHRLSFMTSVVFTLAPVAARAQAPVTPAAPSATNAPPAPNTTPSAAAMDEGRAHFGKGLTLYHEGDFAGALAEFRRADEVAPSYRILYNLAETQYELKDYASALAAFEAYLSQGGGEISNARRAQVETDIRNLRQRVAHIEVTTSVTGAEVSVDGVVVGTSPLPKALVVNLGRRVVTASKPGMSPASKTLDVAGGDEAHVALDLLVPAPAVAAVTPVLVPTPVALPAAPLPNAAPAAVRAHDRSMTPVWVGVGVTGALVAAYAICGGLTLGANSSYNAELSRFPGSPSGIADAHSRVRTFAVASDILAGTAIASGAVTVYLALTRHNGDPAVASTQLGLAPDRVSFRYDF
jgi:hypothetical protein